jgi:hypothetical protein
MTNFEAEELDRSGTHASSSIFLSLLLSPLYLSLSLSLSTFPLSLSLSRAEFRGEKINSFIDGSPMRYFSSAKRLEYMRQSFITIGLFVLLVAAVTGAVYLGRYFLRQQVDVSIAQVAASVANALQIQFFNFTYNLVATALTNRENHRSIPITPLTAC